MEPEQLEANKQIIRDYFQEQTDQGLESALRHLSPDATWWVPGNWELSGTYTKAQLAERIGELPYDGLLKFELGFLTAESNRVAAEVNVSGCLKDGRDFEFWIHFLFRVDGGLIEEVREYVDSQYTRALFFGSAGQDKYMTNGGS